MNDGNITITGKPHVAMVVTLIFILGLIIPGLLLPFTGFDNHHLGVYLFISGLGLYFICVALLYFIHRYTINKLLVIIDGGRIVSPA